MQVIVRYSSPTDKVRDTTLNYEDVAGTVNRTLRGAKWNRMFKDCVTLNSY
jgi:hypothetical protein